VRRRVRHRKNRVSNIGWIGHGCSRYYLNAVVDIHDGHIDTSTDVPLINPQLSLRFNSRCNHSGNCSAFDGRSSFHFKLRDSARDFVIHRLDIESGLPWKLAAPALGDRLLGFLVQRARIFARRSITETGNPASRATSMNIASVRRAGATFAEKIT